MRKSILFENEDAISLLLGRKFAVVTPRETALDIDTELDFMVAEKVMEHFQDQYNKQ